VAVGRAMAGVGKRPDAPENQSPENSANRFGGD
jgi:hypothetical protein